MHHSLSLQIPTDFLAQCKQILTPRAPHHNEQITVYVQNLQQLLAEFKRNAVNEVQLLEKLRNTSHLLKRRHSFYDTYRNNDLPKQIENLNKIKQDNERILKGRIKFLEDKFKHVEFFNTKKDGNYHQQLQFKLQEKTKALIRAENDKRIFQNNLAILQQQNNNLRRQIHELRQHISKIYKAPIRISEQSQTISVTHLDSWVQTEKVYHWQTSTFTQTQSEKKVLAVHKHDYVKYQPINQSNAEVETLNLKVESLEMSNSSLRKEMVRIHDYMEQQDEKYRQNLQKLEEKIKKLTTHDQMRQSRTKIVQSNCRWGIPLRRSSDLGFEKYPSLYQEKLASSQVVQIADLKIKLELSKNNSPTKKSEQDSKMTLSSALSQNQ